MKVLTVVVLLCFSLSARSATIEQAVANLQDKKFDLALTQFTELASLGNKDAQYSVGAMYINGNGVEKNYVTGYAWVKLASSKKGKLATELLEKLEAALPRAMLDNGEKVYQSLLEEYSDEVVVESRKPKIAKGSSGEYRDYKPIRKKAPTYPKGMAKKQMSGSVMVEYDIDQFGRTRHHRVLSASHNAFKRSSIEAMLSFLYKPATIDSSPVYSYAVINKFSYVMGGGKPDDEQVVKLLGELELQAETGTSMDRYRFANSIHLFATLNGMSDKNYDIPNQNEWFYKSAVDGQPHAQYRIGSNILYGEQCVANKDTAHYWLTEAAQRGSFLAQFLLGMERYNGVRFDKNVQEGLTLLRRAADLGYDNAQVVVAKLMVLNKSKDQNTLNQAKSYIDSVNPKKYYDLLSYYESKALVYASLGDTSAALKAQKKLVKYAKNRKLPMDDILDNLSRIENGDLPLIEL